MTGTPALGRRATYRPDWASLQNHATPPWFREAKLGIYAHWGVYAVPAGGPNATWYPRHMDQEGHPQHRHHVRADGDPSAFGYKDFIPLFTGERFDPDGPSGDGCFDQSRPSRARGQLHPSGAAERASGRG